MKKNFFGGSSKKTTSKGEQPNNRTASYAQIICILVTIFIIIIFFSQICLIRFVPSESMLPSIKQGDVILVNALAYQRRDIQRGDIIVFQGSKTNAEQDLVKRVIGLPGDHISFEHNQVHINGSPLDESTYLDPSIKTLSDKTFDVPQNCYFVLGDNREHSSDARFWDTPYLEKKDIKGRVFVSIRLSFPFFYFI